MPAVALDQNIFPLSVYGPVQPTTLLGPVRRGLGKYGDGLFIEEGTTNLYASDPEIPGLSPGGGGDATSVSTVTRYGRGSTKVTKSATSGDYQNQGAFAVTFPSAGTYAVACDVWCSSDTYGTLSLADDGSYTGSTLVGSTTFATGTYAQRWVRVTRTITVVSGDLVGSFIVRTSAAAAAGFVNYVTGVQVESKGYPTSFCVGSLATAWNATGNLLPAAAQSFEDGTTTGTSVLAGTATLTNSTAQFHSGTRSLLATVTATASLTVISAPISAPVTPGKTYSVTQWVRPSAARQLRCDVYWYTAALAFIGATTVSASTGVANTWTRQGVSAVAPATPAYAVLVFTSTDATNGDLFYIDDQRIEEGTGAASYRWTGAENASASTRTASGLRVAFPSGQAGPLTLAAWVRVGQPPTATHSVSVARLYGGSTAGLLSCTTTGQQFSTILDVACQVGSAPVAGDLVFLCGTIAADGKTHNLYTATNGGALQTATPVTSATSIGTPTAVDIGWDEGSQFADSVIEQVLVYSRALSGVEVAALAVASSETTYASDPGIVLAAATGVARGTTTAETAAGVGYYRADRSLKGYVENITPGPTSPDDDAARIKITVPAGSGVGQGQSVGVGYPLGSYAATVLRVFAPGGAYDELYA